MKRRKINLTLPSIRKFREAIANGNIGAYLIESGEEVTGRHQSVLLPIIDYRGSVNLTTKDE